MSAAPLLVALLATAPAQETPSFGVAVESVYLDVFVSRRGEPVRGLRAENFVVLDNGVRQAVRLVDLEDAPIGAILVFDTSGSVAHGLGNLLEAGHAVLDGLRDTDQAALITFDHAPRLRVEMTSDLRRVGDALDAVEVGGSTALYDAVYAGLRLPAGDARPLVVLFTDGDDKASWLTAEEVLEDAPRSEAVVQVVGLSDYVFSPYDSYNRRFTGPTEGARVKWLRKLVQLTGGRYWQAESAGRLKETFLQVVAEMAARYVLAFEPEGVPREGIHELEVTLEGAKGDVRARERYVIR